MWSLIRHALLALFLLMAVSITSAQNPPSSVLPSPSGSASLVYASSRTVLDLDVPLANGKGTDADPGVTSGAVRSQRPVYAASRPWLFAENGVGGFVSPLGIGIGGATSLAGSLNLRAAGNFFGYNLNGLNSGVTYRGSLSFRSLQASMDWFPWHKSFHLSPGVLFYNQNHATVHGGVAAGQSFTVNGATYYSGAADPVILYGHVAFRRTSPMFTAGWGNWLPRSRERHFSLPIDIGFAYVGNAPLNLTFSGVVCDTPRDINCRSIDSDPTVQQNIDAQRKKYQNDLNYVRFYPILSTGVAYKF
ncbi:MAG: hypothetical protein JOZ33_13055 [Acidobacteriaceae bacterium]|nr:hypothetical protein [Acidobacteriaceae bacterium]